MSKQGPNQGRSFFACSASRRSGEPGQLGCKFFKWEDSDESSSPNFSSKTFVIPKSAKENVAQGSKSFSAYLNKPEKVTLKCRPSFPAKLPISSSVLTIVSNKNVDSGQTIFGNSSHSNDATVTKENVDQHQNIKDRKSFSAVSFSRPTLGIQGPARRSLSGHLPALHGSDEARTPEIKRTRLNFNPPKFHHGKQQTIISNVAPQYFGNVPLQFS